MWTSDEIAVFSPGGDALGRFTADGLDGPRGIAFNPFNGEIWIASEFSNAIFIFDNAHRFLRRLEHADFNEPVGVTFTSTPGVDASNQSVYISNSNGNEIMVFNQTGDLLRRFTGTALKDPNCSAFMQDGSFFVSNRLGGSTGSRGSVSAFNTEDTFQFDFTSNGILSLMAVARDPNNQLESMDDTLWVSSGSGDSGIYEFDLSGNLLTSLLPGDIDDGRPIVPQGIAFDSSGSFFVVSYSDEVLKFDGEGQFLMRFPTGAGTSRSTAFQGCRAMKDGRCIPFGADSPAVNGSNGSPAGPSTGKNSGGGFPDLTFIALLLMAWWWRLLRPRRQHDMSARTLA